MKTWITKDGIADTDLMPAARSMYAALAEALDIFETTEACNDVGSDEWAWAYAARAALAKARGQS